MISEGFSVCLQKRVINHSPEQLLFILVNSAQGCDLVPVLGYRRQRKNLSEIKPPLFKRLQKNWKSIIFRLFIIEPSYTTSISEYFQVSAWRVKFLEFAGVKFLRKRVKIFRICKCHLGWLKSTYLHFHHACKTFYRFLQDE